MTGSNTIVRTVYTSRTSEINPDLFKALIENQQRYQADYLVHQMRITSIKQNHPWCANKKVKKPNKSLCEEDRGQTILKVLPNTNLGCLFFFFIYMIHVSLDGSEEGIREWWRQQLQFNYPVFMYMKVYSMKIC